MVDEPVVGFEDGLTGELRTQFVNQTVNWPVWNLP